MEQSKQKTLLSMVYYALVSITILLGVIFMIYLATQSVPLYAKICFWILADALIGLVIFDIVCTNIKRFKFIAGIILYVLSLVTFALSIIVYITLSTNLILSAVQVFPYLALFVLSWTMTIFSIVLYTIGLHLIQRPKRSVKTSK